MSGKRYNFTVHLKDAPSGLIQFLVRESPLKMMKNAFYFTLKPIFCLDFLVMQKNGLIRNISNFNIHGVTA